MAAGTHHVPAPRDPIPQPLLGHRLPSLLNRALVGYAAAVIAVCWAFGAWHLYREYTDTLERSARQLQTVAVGVTQHIEAMIHDGIGTAQAVLNVADLQGGYDSVDDAVLEQMLAAALTGGEYVQGLFLASEGRLAGARRNGVSLAAWADAGSVIRRLQSTGGVAIGSPVFDPAQSERPLLAVAVPIMTAEGRVVLAGALFGIDSLNVMYDRLQITGGIVALVAHDGRLLMRVPAPPEIVRLLGQQITVEGYFDRVESGWETPLRAFGPLTRVPMIYMGSRVSSYPADVMVGLTEAVVMAPWRIRAYTTLGILVVASVLVVLLTVFLRRSIVRLDEREAEYRALFDSSMVSVFLHRGPHLVEMNRTAREMYGLESATALGSFYPWALSPERQPDGTLSEERAKAYMQAARAAGRVRFHWLARRADTGASFPTDVSLSVLEGDDFDLMLTIVQDVSELEQAREAMERLNVVLEHRVRQRTRELEQANLQLVMANQELESFAAAASHDLRSPLGAISGMAGLLEAELAEGRQDTVSRRLVRIQEAVKRMADLIDGLLGLARMTMVEGYQRPVDLGVLAREIEVELRAQYPDHAVVTSFSSGLVVEADPRLMRTVLTNLLGNAWKYTAQAASPRVELRCRRAADGTHEYVVWDNGVGFDMRYSDKLFKPFRRLHSAEEFPGVGIGLATVARIVRRYGGTIRGESHPQHGTCFAFTLPAAEMDRRGTTPANVA